LERAQALAGYQIPLGGSTQTKSPLYLKQVYDRWVLQGTRSVDSIKACERSLKLFEKCLPNQDLHEITRAQGDEFRSWLISQPTTSKTARDRLNWIKSLLRYATQDLEYLVKNPWVGLNIGTTTSKSRYPWTNQHLEKLFSHQIWCSGHIPNDKKAGGTAAYWVPLLALFTGARCSELCQLSVADICTEDEIPTIRITNEGEGQKVKTTAGNRVIPIHSRLIALGFLDFVRTKGDGELWDRLPKRSDKAGGYFSQFFSRLRRDLGIPSHVVFHSFRHNVRSALAEKNVSESVIDKLLGHEGRGSMGAKVYTHVGMETFRQAIELLNFPSPILAFSAHVPQDKASEFPFKIPLDNPSSI
jgi:integrase